MEPDALYVDIRPDVLGVCVCGHVLRASSHALPPCYLGEGEGFGEGSDEGEVVSCTSFGLLWCQGSGKGSREG